MSSVHGEEKEMSLHDTLCSAPIQRKLGDERVAVVVHRPQQSKILWYE